jgi:cytochrome P450
LRRSDRAALSLRNFRPFVTDFIPPKPRPHKRKLSPLRRILEVRHSSISVLFDRSYSMHLGDVWTPTRSVYFLNQPALVDQVLVKDADKYPKSISMGSMLEFLMGTGVFVSNGELWRKQRRMLDPAFSQARIQDVFPLMRIATEAMAARFRAHADGEVLPIDEETTHVTADIIFRTIYSRALTADESRRIFRAFSRFQELAYAQGVWRMAGVPRWLSLGRVFAARHARIIRRLLENGIQDRLEEQASGGGTEHKDILASLLKARDPVSGEQFTRKDLVDQISVLFLAGHETSASVLAWALYLIAMRPDIQDRLHAEAVAAFGDREPEFSDMRKLRLARDVFRETLRLYPPVSFMSRDATEHVRLRNKDVAPGDMIFVSPWLIHRHTRLWKRPDVFDPDRFSDPASKKSQRTAYIPFSAGPRVCLGASFAMQEGILILAYLARHFRFEPVEGHTPKPIARLTLRSENGVRLRVFRRDPAAKPAATISTASAAPTDGCPFHG